MLASSSSIPPPPAITPPPGIARPSYATKRMAHRVNFYKPLPSNHSFAFPVLKRDVSLPNRPQRSPLPPIEQHSYNPPPPSYSFSLPSQFQRVTKGDNIIRGGSNATRQVINELKEMKTINFAEDQVQVEMVNESPFDLVVTLFPTDGLYKDGEFKVSMKLSHQYPKTRPICKFVTPIFHPNVTNEGDICFSLLDQDHTLRIADFAHGFLWLLFYPNLFSKMNPDCPLDEKEFATLVRRSVAGHQLFGVQYLRSSRLPPLLVDEKEEEEEEERRSEKKKELEKEEEKEEEKEKKEEKEEMGDFLRSEKNGKSWVWKMVGEEWVQVFDEMK